MELSYACLVEHQWEDMELLCDPLTPDDGCEIRMPSDNRGRGFVVAGDREREEMRVLQERRQRRARSLETGSERPLVSR
jgi:hypothetical protein